MDNRPIGVFDSGIGGLSCVSSLLGEFPNEGIIYFGDTARTPYGDKAPETIREFASQITEFLVSKDIKMLVIACNTISALCTDMIQQRYPEIPVVDIIRPTVSYLTAQNQPGKNIGIVATKATVQSGVYEALLRNEGVQGTIVSQACPLLVPMIECGFRDGPVVEAVVHNYLDQFIYENEIDTLVLGCTHYPFIADTIRELYPEVEIVNPSKIISGRVADMIRSKDMMARPGEEYTRQFYASDLSDTFRDMLRQIDPGEHYSVKFKVFKGMW